jgi:hypothetical protein
VIGIGPGTLLDPLGFIVGVYTHLAARVPVTGYAGQGHRDCRTRTRAGSKMVRAVRLLRLDRFDRSCPRIGVRGRVLCEAHGRRRRTDWGDGSRSRIAINPAGVCRPTLTNNIGATVEIVGTLGIAAIIAVGLSLYKHQPGPSILLDSSLVGGGSAT